MLLAIFVAWIEAAQLLYVHIYDPRPPVAAIPFFLDVLTSGRGWLLIVLGGSIGFCFAAIALCISVVSFPLMLDRNVGLVPAVTASLLVSRKNPVAVALWGLLVALALVVGSLPLFVGLAVVMPVLGHSTWRFYRRAIERDPWVARPNEKERTAGDSANASFAPRNHPRASRVDASARRDGATRGQLPLISIFEPVQRRNRQARPRLALT